jgi:uncharacterized protein YjbI with pentapeptide repeats
LEGADFRGSDLEGADLENKKLTGKYHHIVNIGSENGTLEMYEVEEDCGWIIRRGCFTGSKQDFLDKVDETHGNNEHGVKYKKIIELFCD